MQVIYEVNLEVDADIAEDFGAWLRPHITQLLELPGFLHGEWQEAEAETGNKRLWSVRYHVASREDLQNYFDEHAARLRGDGMTRFGGKFKASRRILQNVSVVPQVAHKVVLWYFDCMGRAQPMRYFLTDAGVSYEDRVVTMEEWPALKLSGAVGPLQLMPALEWNGAMVAQTEAIAHFLGDTLNGMGQGPARADNLSLLSSLYSDVISPTLQLIWLHKRTPSADLVEMAARPIPRIRQTLVAARTILSNCKSPFLGGNAPGIADWFLMHALHIATRVYGHKEEAGTPLANLSESLQKRDAFQSLTAKFPALTANPDEEHVFPELAKIWAGK